MRSDNPLKHFVLAFVVALVGYLVVYHAIEYRRNRKGPWIVTFANGPSGTSSLVINQPWLGLTNVEIRFTGNPSPTMNGPSTLSFSQPRQVPYEVPFGQCIFMDTTFLPGTVTFALGGHEIELLPRVLVADHLEYPWQSGTNITLPPLGHL